MVDIPIYRAEREADLEAAIRSNARLHYLSPIHASNGPFDQDSLSKLIERSKAARGDFDLHYLDAILVTTGWNRNDDVFDGLETWLARKTPEDKPLNKDHDDTKIVGHIVNNWVMDADGKAIADTAVIDDLPAKFHVVSGLVVYKCWQTPEYQASVDKLLAEIDEGKWFVSMECLFSGFDFSLKASDGSSRTVARNEQTAHLTKHLRAYGGTGLFDGCRIGRVLRNISFSGIGFVENPANPESIIFPNDEKTEASVYSLPTPAIPKKVQELDTAMTIEQQLAEAKTEIEKLKASQTDAVVNELKAAKLEAEKLLIQASKAMSDAETEAKNAIEVKDKDICILAVKLAEAEKSLAEASEELKKLHGERIKDARILALKEAGLDAEAAVTFAGAAVVLDDTAFSAQVAIVAAMKKAVVTFVQVPNSIDKKVDSDKSGEKNAAETSLENAQANKEPALESRVSDDGVNEVRKAIASFFGATTEIVA